MFFLNNGDGSYSLTSNGYALIAFILFAVLIAIAFLAGNNKKFSPRVLIFCSVSIALATVCSMINPFKLPMGGSVTVFSMLFVTIIGYWYGPVIGILGGAAYGLLQFIIDPYILSIPQVFVDYIFAFGALGISGFFSNKKNGLIIGYIVAIFGRYFFAVLSGVIFFGAYATDYGLGQFNALVYSLLYNITYIGAEGIITVVLLLLPSVSQAFNFVKKQAIQTV
ncbi:energy-coupled thiamine transporter ThiT [Lachnospira sp.]|jgi:thiamine transporter|uniref:energy-coupled thiamine transporter ThiT n=1 Tax=Lachnospira sp. TaxID=2049031 RepID=UPI00257BECFF|nr:energy-coupled thiamine transporter ThiT [Lachnospira sp.]